MEKVVKKNILFITRQPPYGRATAREALDALLAASAYDQKLGLLFLGDGIFQLLKEQQPIAGRQKNLAATLPALPMYDINNIYVQGSAMTDRGLTEDQLAIEVQTLSDTEISQLMEQQDQLLSF